MDYNELISDINEALKGLGYGISWNTNIYESNGYVICEISFNYDNFDNDVPNDWDQDVEDKMKDIISDWGDHIIGRIIQLFIRSLIT